MKKFLLAILFVLLISGTASALTYTATLTADNHYSLYYGNESDGINYVGRNEMGSGGDPGKYNWSQAEDHTFDVDFGDYIYIIGWSDDSVAQGWIGQFVSENETILSNTSDWEVFLSHDDLDDDDLAPTALDLQTRIDGASWDSVGFSVDHGSSPWGSIGGITSEADWIWGSPLIGGSSYGEYQVFRTQVAAPVPEPATMFLLGIGLVGLGSLKRRKNNI